MEEETRETREQEEETREQEEEETGQLETSAATQTKHAAPPICETRRHSRCQTRRQTTAVDANESTLAVVQPQSGAAVGHGDMAHPLGLRDNRLNGWAYPLGWAQPLDISQTIMEEKSDDGTDNKEQENEEQVFTFEQHHSDIQACTDTANMEQGYELEQGYQDLSCSDQDSYIKVQQGGHQCRSEQHYHMEEQDNQTNEKQDQQQDQQQD